MPMPIPKILRLVVWAGVALWCWIPPLWLLTTAVLNKPKTLAPSYGGGGGADAGLVVGLGGGLVLLQLLLWAIWCASGVICGVGMEKTIATVADLPWLASIKAKVKDALGMEVVSVKPAGQTASP
jgi:hypothetical protein